VDDARAEWKLGNRRRFSLSVTDLGDSSQSPLVAASVHSAAPRAEFGKTLNFQDIFETEFAYVWNSARRLGVPERDLEDVSHDIFFRVYERWADYDQERPLRPWLFGFAFRVASDYRRRFSHRRELLGVDSESIDPSRDALERVIHAETLSMAQLALDGLEIERRAVFVLHEIDGCPMPEVARALSIPVNTAYSRLRLAREQFQTALRRERLRRGEP
jgi:RNA polymerase sigma-70 factor (ECF subfamily)